MKLTEEQQRKIMEENIKNNKFHINGEVAFKLDLFVLKPIIAYSCVNIFSLS